MKEAPGMDFPRCLSPLTEDDAGVMQRSSSYGVVARFHLGVDTRLFRHLQRQEQGGILAFNEKENRISLLVFLALLGESIDV